MGRRLLLVTFSIVLLLSTLAADASARDWFVRAGASAGDGSLAKPFGGVWQALDACLAGDKIHVSEGKYYGKLETGTWVIPWPRVELLGGYDKAFAKRNPWKTPSELLWKKGSKNISGEARVSGSLQDHEGVVFDGFIVDMRNENIYRSDGGLRQPYPKGAVRIFHKGAKIRNNVILNSAKTAITTGMATTVENNLILNQLMNGIEIRGSSKQGSTPATLVKNNTILFTWDDKAGPGTGATRGLGINTKVATRIENNLLAYTDNNAVVVYRHGSAPLSAITLKDNVFFMNAYANFKFQMGSKDIAIDNGDMDALEDLGFAKQGGNQVVDPKLPLDKGWMDQFSRRKPAEHGKVTMDDLNQARSVLGLPVIAKGGTAAEGVAPAWKLASALKLMAPGKGSLKAGARAKDLPVTFSAEQAPVAAVPAKNYKSVKLKPYVRDARAVDGQALEMIVALGRGVAPRGLDEVKTGKHKAIYLCVPERGGTQIYGYYPKGTATQKFLDPIARNGPNCSRPPEQTYRVRGTMHAIRGVPKAGFMIDSIELVETDSGPKVARPKGRDWFVRAGAKGGDGSKAKPFKDPYKALKKAGVGDSIHVTEGTYTGFLKSGEWTIGKKYLSLVGGYDKKFSQRDPWKHPSLLTWPKGAKTDQPKNTVTGVKGSNHEGFILDGFVFDRRNQNVYSPNGDLRAENSENGEIVYLWEKGLVIRNCVFLNSAASALRLSGGVTLENNLFLNMAYQMVNLKRVTLAEGPIVIRNNTFLFSWNKKNRAGSGQSPQGYGLLIQGKAKTLIEGNAFQFIDNYGIKLFEKPKNVTFKNNIFSHVLYANLMGMRRALVDNKSMHLLGQMGFLAQSGNKVCNPNFDIDGKWFDNYLSRTASTPGKVTDDEWNQVRELLGRPVIVRGGKSGVGFAPAYDMKQALNLFARARKCQAGAKHLKLKVTFGQ